MTGHGPGRAPSGSRAPAAGSDVRPGGDVPADGLVVLVTSPRVAPGLLSWPAWQALRTAGKVLAASADHPLLPALGQAQITCEIPPPEPAAGRAARLIGLARATTGHVVWLAAQPLGPPVARPDGLGHADDDLLRAIVAAGSDATVLYGSHDLPGGRLVDLVRVMDLLRTRCPWDAKQTHRSLAPHLIEESYEALEALESGDEHALRDELGDVLLQVVFHARIAAERGDGTGFSVDDVADTIVAKLVRRHPHVFGGAQVSGADEVKSNWAAIKAAERADKHGGPVSALDGIPFGQPALSLAGQLRDRAVSCGMPADVADLGGDVGSELFARAAAARAAGLDPELELRAAARRFSDRFRAWERGDRAAR